MALDGIILLGAGLGYSVLSRELIHLDDGCAALARATGDNLKGRASVLGYLLAIPLAFWIPFASCAIYAFVALAWIIPDPRIEKTLGT